MKQCGAVCGPPKIQLAFTKIKITHFQWEMYIVDYYIGKTRNRNDEKDALFLPRYKKQQTRSSNPCAVEKSLNKDFLYFQLQSADLRCSAMKKKFKLSWLKLREYDLYWHTGFSKLKNWQYCIHVRVLHHRNLVNNMAMPMRSPAVLRDSAPPGTQMM